LGEDLAGLDFLEDLRFIWVWFVGWNDEMKKEGSLLGGIELIRYEGDKMWVKTLN
jgi:hypothetical protein